MTGSTRLPRTRRLLRYLARELLLNNYDLKAIERRILSSHAYQRKTAIVTPEANDPARRLFAGPYRRRMTAEELVDLALSLRGQTV